LAGDPLGVDDQARAPSEHVQPPLAKPRTKDPLVGALTGLVAPRRVPQADQSTHPPRRQTGTFLQLPYGLPPNSGRQEFVRRRSLSIWLSRACSATRRLSRTFSSSSAFSRRASPTSCSPSLARQR
jgi:hypothetical protein